MLHQDWLLLGAIDLEAPVDIGPQGHSYLITHIEGLLMAELEVTYLGGQKRA